ncbi:MAG: peptidoglycan-binding protein [Phascolarctobacterium sp.]|nr:peptidoglycan-binding protein [Candidatus Phascolarctobacterium caballi]
MSIINDACEWAVAIANDNSHGYSQQVRWGNSYDCSSFVISAYDHAFQKAEMLYRSPKLMGATYTGNMRTVFQKCGFDVLPNQPVSQLKRGDVLLNDATHTALYIGNGQIVHARSGEGTTDTIDNSGNEICVQGFYGTWDCVLRYTHETVEDEPQKPVQPVETCIATLPVLKMGMISEAVRQWQLFLLSNKISVGIDGADGDFGQNTYNATVMYQQRKGIAATGIVGKETFEKMWS